jgi:hypothetical protein
MFIYHLTGLKRTTAFPVITGSLLVGVRHYGKMLTIQAQRPVSDHYKHPWTATTIVIVDSTTKLASTADETKHSAIARTESMYFGGIAKTAAARKLVNIATRMKMGSESHPSGLGMKTESAPITRKMAATMALLRRYCIMVG